MTERRDNSTDAGTVTIHDHEATHAGAPHSGQLSVLIVEGDQGVASMLEALLVARGSRVVCARSALMANEALAEEPFAIVVIDRELEDGDGLRLCADVRRRDEPGYVYIILVLASDSREDVIAGLQAGADDFLRRNLNEAELIARLNTANRIVGLERALRQALSERAQSLPAEDTNVTQIRTLLLRRIGRDLDRAQNVQTPLSVLAMDIDSFKAVNDRYGHVAGDELLRQLANRARFALPHDQDWIARIGGEEFVVVLPGIDLENAATLAERLRSTVAATPFHVAGADVSITVSVGVGSLSTLGAEEEVGASALLDQADRYLYRSKLAGRNRVSTPVR